MCTLCSNWAATEGILLRRPYTEGCLEMHTQECRLYWDVELWQKTLHFKTGHCFWWWFFTGCLGFFSSFCPVSEHFVSILTSTAFLWGNVGLRVIQIWEAIIWGALFSAAVPTYASPDFPFPSPTTHSPFSCANVCAVRETNRRTHPG